VPQQETVIMPDWPSIVNFGVPMVILSAVGVALWKLGWYVVFKVFGNEVKGTRGIVGEWVDVEKKEKEANTEALKKVSERLDAQTQVCLVHGATVRDVSETLKIQMSTAKAAHEAALVAAQQATEGNASLNHIDEVLSGRTDAIQHTAEGMQALKACAFHLCDLCQAFVAREFPNSVADVSGYLNAIKKKVNDEA
jgi:hypothetical protein